jgi:hypothetical protein
VGALAEMSGQAAREIEMLLEESKLKVTETLDLIQSRVDEGHRVSERASATFHEITLRVTGMNSQMRSINEATHQQEIGIQQTSTAMKQMDQSSMANSQASLETQKTSERLRDGSDGLRSVTEELRKLVAGDGPTGGGLRLKSIISKHAVPEVVAHGEGGNHDLESIAHEIAKSHQPLALVPGDSAPNSHTDYETDFKKVV